MKRARKAHTYTRLTFVRPRYEHIAACLCVGLLSLYLVSCSALKKTTNENKTSGDTSKVEAVSEIDSATNAVSNAFGAVKNFFGSALKGLTTKDSPIFIPPSSTVNPTAQVSGPGHLGYPPIPVQRKLTFDSVGNVTVHDQILGGDMDDSSTYSLDDYIAQKREQGIQDGYQKSAQSYSLTQSGSTTQNKNGTNGTQQQNNTPGILSDYGHVEIPIPPSIVPTIFGKPSINLRVNGDVAIHLAYRDNQFLQSTGAYFSGSETGLDFKQEVNMNIQGSIGDKVKISTDFGSLRQFSFDNLFKLSYQGYPDEIIQSVEAGNVSLTTPSKYIGTQSALFGFKGVMRFGPVYVTALAAQKKGERQTKTFGGGPGSSTATDFLIHPANYRRNMFFLDTSYIPTFQEVYSTIPTGTNNADIVTAGTVEVWRSTTVISDIHTRHAAIYYSLPPISQGGQYFTVSRTPNSPDANLITTALMSKVDTSQYHVDPKTGVIAFYQEPSDYDVYAVSYQTPGGQQYGEQMATGGDTIILKMIKPRLLYANVKAPSFQNLLKNTYYVGATNIDPRNFSVKIAYTFPDGTVYDLVRSSSGFDKAITALGLDRIDNSTGAPIPDGAFDVISGSTPLLDTRSGTLIFPYLQPFGQRVLDYLSEQTRKNRKKYHPDSTFYFPIIYSNVQENLRADPTFTKNDYITIDVKYAGGNSTIINLNAFNIVDGSVRVSIAGQQLVENVDYRVDINSGTLTLLKPDLAAAGPMTVEYDTHDIFTTSTKSVLGLRAEMPIENHGLIGVSLMNYSMHLPTLKTRPGEEPMSNWILGADASYKVPLPMLTNWMNALPVFNLKDKSEMNFRFDAALSIPNPNTETSPMAVDNGASIAYLDDFEGGRNEFPLSMNYARWVASSQPVTQSYASYTTDQITAHKSKAYWYSAYPQNVRITDILPNKSVANPNDQAQVLDVVFDPTNPHGIYNHSPSGDVPEKTWAGLMQYQQGLNVQATNTDAIEFWMNVNELNGTDAFNNAVLHFDMGQISEDVIPDGILETEDKNGNGRYDPGEDNGLDTIADPQEPGYNAQSNPDPDNDDYSYSTSSQTYDNINGTEGNSTDAVSGTVRLPDTEDLNSNTSLDLDNSYYEYDIPLVPTNKFVIGNTNNTWYQYRIPLTAFARTVGQLDSSFSNITFFRMWFTGFTQLVHLRFYDIGLFGSQWTRGLTGLSPTNPAGDTTLSINYVSVEDNTGPPTNYTSPPGAQRDQLAGAATVVYGNEQSLALQLHCVPAQSRREAIRLFPTPNDIFNYRAMAIWVHGDNSMPATVPDSNGRVWVYFRFGSDQYNYYEYRRPLTSGWQNIHVDFGTLTSLKATKRNYSQIVQELANDGYTGSLYRVIGSPNLTNAPYFVLGVDNEAHDSCLTTEVWFDELRLLNANNTIDYAMNGSISTKLAEFGTVTANFLYERPDFHRVDERFNMTRSLNSGWGVTGEFQMQKLLPSWLEAHTKFPLVVAHTESLITPKYFPNNDVEVSAAIAKIQSEAANGQISQADAKALTDSIRLTNETLTVRNTISATGVQFSFPGSFFLLPLFVNRLVYSFGYGEEFTRSPIYEYYRNWSWTGSIGYDLPISPPLLKPLSWVSPSTFDIGRYSDYKIDLLPTRITLGASATRSRLHYLDRVSTLVFFPGATPEDTVNILNSLQQYVNRIFTANRTMAFNWKLTENGLISPTIDYFLDVTSNLAPLETYNVNNAQPYYDPVSKTWQYPYDSVYFYQRPFNSILGDIFFKNGALVNPGQDFLETQRFKLSTSPHLPWLLWLDKYVRPIFTYSVEYKWMDAQTGLQNEKTGQWKNIINTGFEINLREFGIDIFGPDQVAQKGKKPGTNSPPGSKLQRPQENPGQSAANEPSQQSEQTLQNPEPRRMANVRRVGDAPNQKLPTLLPPPDTSKKGGATEGGTPVRDTLHHILGVGTEGIHDDLSVSDTTLIPVAPAEQTHETFVEQTEPGLTTRDVLKTLIQKPFTDWNGTKFNFTETNFSYNGALQGNGPGITNFLARGIFSPEDDANGPSRAYQLGLITDPSGRLLINFIPKFPFVQFGVRHGLREGDPFGHSVLVNDVFSQTNVIELTTSRPLWSGASISLNWKTDFDFTENDALNIGPDGSITPFQIMKTGDVSRTFLSIPPLPFLNISQSSIERVGQMWLDKTAALGYATQADRDGMSPALRNSLQVQSFMQGFETLPMFSNFLREYLPRLNYSFIWSGLEKFPLFSFADRASFRNAYSGSYKRTFKLNPGDSVELTTLQTITYAFRPLAALDLGWDKVWGGKLTVSANYDTQTDWASDYSFNRITSRRSTTIGINANFQKTGLSIPFLKLLLKNNFGATFQFSETISSDVFYTFDDILTTPGGISSGGITKFSAEPRFSYDVNQQLTIEGFYRYERTTPAATGVLVPPTRTITAGFDIRLKVF